MIHDLSQFQNKNNQNETQTKYELAQSECIQSSEFTIR